ncbi:ComGF family competence protein [Aneurinibacillus tyrosinisolvens]|uniref:ComGF family competence protein n=1 Tax=Aneurinibacillus tyrosinisolvens TaxID=1443435 RepID=UPI00063F8958|nr:ComGF family competence protein [Aneurinibacillus tyrosinisolvens]
MIEVLLSSAVLFMLAVTVMAMCLHLSKDLQKAKDEALLDTEARAFFSYIEEEIQQSGGYTVVNDSLHFYDKNGNLLIYDRWGSKLRRRVNYEGYVVLLNYVQSAVFKVSNQGCRVDLLLAYGDAEWRGSLFIAGRAELPAAAVL